MPKTYGKRKQPKKTQAKPKSMAKIKKGDYMANTLNNKTAITTISKRLDKLDKQMADVKPSIDLYISDYKELKSEFANSNNFLLFDALIDPPVMRPAFDHQIANRKWYEAESCTVKRLSLYCKVKLFTSTLNPIKFTYFIFSPKNAYKQIQTTNADTVLNPDQWLQNRDYSYINAITTQALIDAGLNTTTYNYLIEGTGARNNIKLNNKLYTVHKKGSFTLAKYDGKGPDSEHVINYSQKINLKLKQAVKHAAIESYANSWRDVNPDDIPFTKQMYIVIFHGGFRNGTTTGNSGDGPIIMTVNQQVSWMLSQKRREGDV